MHMRVVNMRIKPELVEMFKASSAEGIEQLLAEPGVVSSALLQKVDEPASFLFIEAYVSAEVYEEHLKSDCFLDWQKQVVSLLDGEAASVEYEPVYPPKEAWVQESAQGVEGGG
ncbi:MAG: antibiotic biosynthesis monooxygenase [Chloroflexi bacterium]|nr:antibiotic biosynthesis monooxygenase [Chloroflexota bacterium]